MPGAANRLELAAALLAPRVTYVLIVVFLHNFCHAIGYCTAISMTETLFTLAEDLEENPDRPPPLVVKLSSVTKQEIRRVTRELIDHLQLAYDLRGIETHLGARPVEFQHRALRLDERAFWTLALRSGALTASDVVEYVGMHLDHVAENEDLAFCSHADIVGQEAMYAALDLYLPRSQIDRLYQDALETLTPCFIQFIERCDLDHEVYQHTYILSMLNYLLHNDLEAWARLFVYRCTHGQLWDLGFEELNRFLVGSGALKAAVDHVLSLSISDTEITELVLTYCSVVYGSGTELTDDVLDYCAEQVPMVSEHELFPPGLSRISFYRAARDLYWSNGKAGGSIVDTGFHLYRRFEHAWSSVD